MAYTVLARKYRSANFDQVVGQDHIAQTLKRAIESGRIAHAFLFCGTRGTGKTSMARILAKALNCEKFDKPTTTPCGTCTTCQAIARGDDMDVIEIDAASNRGIDEVRRIIENARLSPARSRFKVYIIDEVHAMTKDAFNALLKVLEEPPAHVKFVLATTEPEKVLSTILSRCQRYDFRNIPTREIAAHLNEICKTEGIEAQDDALLLVAKAGAGSMRDALSVLDRLLSVGEKNLTVEMVEQLLGLPKVQLLFELCEAIGTGDVKKTLEQVAATIARGMSADSLVAALVDHLRNLLVLRTCGPESQLVEVPGIPLKDLVAQAGRFDAAGLTQGITILEELRRHMRQSQSGRALLDATLVRLALAEQFTPIAQLLEEVQGSEPAQKKNVPSAGATQIVAPRSLCAGPVEMPAALVAPVEPIVTQANTAPSTAAAIRPAAVVAPIVSPPPSLDLDEDDDLPRPGKVWDNSGPSLSELLARQNSAPATSAADNPSEESPSAGGSAEPDIPANSSPAGSNLEPAGMTDLTAAWQALLEQIKGQQGVLGVLSNATLVGIEDQQAVIRFSSAAFKSMVEKNGRREMISENLSQVLGRPVGLRLVVDSAPAAASASAISGPAAESSPAASAQPASPRRSAAAPPPPPAPEPAPGIRVTPELVEQMRKDPLIAAVIDAFNATPVKVE